MTDNYSMGVKYAKLQDCQEEECSTYIWLKVFLKIFWLPKLQGFVDNDHDFTSYAESDLFY